MLLRAAVRLVTWYYRWRLLRATTRIMQRGNVRMIQQLADDYRMAGYPQIADDIEEGGIENWVMVRHQCKVRWVKR